MNVNFPLDISALSAIRHLLVTCMVMTMTSQARLSTDPTGVSNSIGDGGNDIINVIQGEVLNFRFSASTPSGSPAEISNFELLVDDAPSNAASFVKLAEGGFRVHWTASVPLDYPNTKLLQRVAVRDTTSQETMILGCVDVAEWEGMVAGVRMGDFVNEGANYQHCSHYSGKYLEPKWLENSNADVWSSWYRGPKRMVLLDGNGGNTGVIAQITDSARYPFFIFTGTSSVPSLVDVSDPLAYPDKGTWCQNFLSAPVSVEVPASATISPGELKLVPFPAIDPRDSFNMVVNNASYQDSSGKHGVFETMTRYLDGGSGRSMHFLWFGKQDGRDTAGGKQIFLPLGATITPYRAGSLADPGLPLNLPSFPPSPYEPSILPIQSEQWHQVVLKAGPEAGVAPDGLELKLGSGDTGDGAPQPGISIQVSSPSGLAPLAIPADGKIPLATGSDLYQRLTSTKGLTIFIKRDQSVDQLHHMSLNLMPKANSRSTGPPIQCAALDLLPVDIKVVKEGEVAAHEDGLVVKKTDTVRYRLSPGLPDAPLLLEDKIQWHWRILKLDGSYAEWTAYRDGQGHTFIALPKDAGIYEVKAVLNGQDLFFSRKSDAHHADSSTGEVQAIHKKDAHDCLGVVDEDWQIKLRNAAQKNLGSTRWAEAVELVLSGVNDFPNPSDKCNAFVYEQGYNAGTPVPLNETWRSAWPPIAFDWWNDNTGRLDNSGRTMISTLIQGWQRLPGVTNPQPGFVVSRPDLLGGPPKYHSHVGILDYDGSWISAGPLKVNKYYHPTSSYLDDQGIRKKYQPQAVRKFKP